MPSNSYCYVYVFLLLCMFCIICFIVPTGTLRLLWLRFFRAISSVVRQMPGYTYFLTPWSRVLLEKLTVNFAASQEIPLIFGPRKSLTVPKSTRQLPLSWANSIQYPRTPPTSWRSILILSSHLRLGLPNGLFPLGLPTCAHLYPPRYAPPALPISFVSILPPAQYWVRSTDHPAPRYAAFSIPCHLILLRSKHSPQHPILKHPQSASLPQ
jgi:hypothetical protein